VSEGQRPPARAAPFPLQWAG